MQIIVAIAIDSQKDQVWNAITDIDNCADMITGIIDLAVLNKPQQGLVGTKWTETRKIYGKQSSETRWITDAEEGEYYSTRAENHGAVYVTKLCVAEHDGKTQLTMSFSVTSESLLLVIVILW